MRMFLRKSTSTRDPLPVAMSGVRMGERLLQVGLADARVMTMLASKPGISGRAALIARDDREATRAQSAAAGAGILIEVHVARDRFPFDDGSFDVAIVHGTGALSTLADEDRATMFRECFRLLRTGGRVLVFEAGTRGGLAALLSTQRGRASDPNATMAALKRGGFHSVRVLADREGYRFIEGLRTKI